jgi:hypothetical protein
MQSDILKAERASLGRPLPYSNLPSGLYVVVKVLDHWTAVVSASTPHGDFFFLIRDIPNGMLEEGFKFTASSGSSENR